MANWFDGYIEANGMKLHYHRTGGKDKPVVVFNHGAMDSGACWTPVVQALEKDFDCIMVDARGHGKSDIGQGDYSSETRAADLLGLIEALELDRPIIGGHSMGADTCIYLAAAHPEAVRAIFLEDPPITQPGGPSAQPGDSEEGNEGFGGFIKIIEQLKQMPKEQAYQIAKEMNPTFPENEIGPWVESKIVLSEDFKKDLVGGNPINTEKTFDVIKKVAVSTLLIIGEPEHMAIVSEDTAMKIAAANANVRYVQLLGASHNIRRDRFDEYITALKEFLTGTYGIEA